MQDKWIFPLSANLSADQAAQLTRHLQTALAQWKAHGTPVPARAAVVDGRFIWIQALGDASGCSIDWLHRMVSDLVAELGLGLMPHNYLYVQSPDGPVAVSLAEVAAAVEAGRLTAESLLYDTTIVHQDGEWIKPLGQSWARRYLRQPA